MKTINIFSHEKKSERYFVFTEGYSSLHRFTIGAFAGDDKVLVVDSGLSLTGELRQYIERVIGKEKPMIEVSTHGAIDHAGGAYLFDEAYCNSRDSYLLAKAFNKDIRLTDLEAFGLENPEIIAYCQAKIAENRTELKNVDEGDVFDLGGIKIEVIAMPGHTPGSVAYFCRDEKVCFTGDAANIDEQIPNIGKSYNDHRQSLHKLLGIPEEGPEIPYKECFLIYSRLLRRLVSIIGEDCTLYSGHISTPLSTAVAENLACACEEIYYGQIEDDPPGESIFKYQSTTTTGKDLRIHFHGNVDIMYDRNNF
jgi:glyoxylase-like metal-dependent hydrolase (beta-lactamase superfamily II)